ncbi:hypothetical protein ACC779_37080, partial [Rhizobium ruizarguesonis]
FGKGADLLAVENIDTFVSQMRHERYPPPALATRFARNTGNIAIGIRADPDRLLPLQRFSVSKNAIMSHRCQANCGQRHRGFDKA